MEALRESNRRVRCSLAALRRAIPRNLVTAIHPY